MNGYDDDFHGEICAQREREVANYHDIVSSKILYIIFLQMLLMHFFLIEIVENR